MSYELVYKEGQDPVEVTLPEARAAALRLVGEDVEHEGTTYEVKEAIFDPTRGIIITTIAGKTFVLVRLKGASKRTPPPHVGAKEKKPKSRGPGSLPTCACGRCKTCRGREHQRKWRNKKKAKAAPLAPRPGGQPPKQGSKGEEVRLAGTRRTTSNIPEENVRSGIVAMFKAGMGISNIAETFDVSPDIIEESIREAIK